MILGCTSFRKNKHCIVSVPSQQVYSGIGSSKLPYLPASTQASKRFSTVLSGERMRKKFYFK